jgi:threonine-phosphate decarboxylase
MIGQLPIHGGQLRQIAERFGIPLPKLIDFSSNINPEGPPPAVIPALRASLEDPATLGCYPDMDQLELKQSIARYAGVSPANVVVANGFVPLLDAALRALRIRHCLLPVPAFVEYRPALIRAETKITPHPLTPELNFAYHIDNILESMLAGKHDAGEHDAILLANPQNPSGVSCNPQALLQLVARAAEQNITVLLDEAFIDYIASDSLSLFVEQFQNLIVFRSVTKFHGIPGLRVAYAAAASEVARSIADNLPPWPVTTLAARAVVAALDDSPYADRTRLLNQERRAKMRSELEELAIHSYNSAANFLLFRLPFDGVSSRVDPAEFWQRMIAGHCLVLRNCDNYEGLGAGHFRAAVRNESDNRILVRAMRQTLADCRAGSAKTR